MRATGTPAGASNLAALTDRKTVFISHANPADNDFTRWLALRLALEGYEVWCDLTKLLGGTNWWVDIEHALRNRTRKFVFVVSKTSNEANGCLKELAVADGVKSLLGDSEFIIPIKIDSLPYRDHNIYINGLNALTFTRGWAEGLRDLLHTFQEQKVPLDPSKGPGVVAAWWNDNEMNRELVRPVPQQHLTNLFRIRSMPSSIWVWTIPDGTKLTQTFPWPVYRVSDRLLSFANAKSLTGRDRSPTGGRGMEIALSVHDHPPREAGIDRSEIRTAVRQLLRQAWDKFASQKNLPLYALSSRRRTLWFPAGSASPNGTPFIGVDGNRTDRQLYGFKTVGLKKVKRFYHYGLEAQPILLPELMLALKAHVIFTPDGSSPYEEVKYQHRARRSQCKAWWNDRWRDLMLAAMSALSGGSDEIDLPLCPKNSPKLETRPAEISSPKSYIDDDVKEPSEDQIGGDEEDEELDDDDVDVAEGKVDEK